MEQILFIVGLIFAGWALHRLGVGATWNVPFLPPPAKPASKRVVTVTAVPSAASVASPVVVAHSAPLTPEEREHKLRDALATVKASFDEQAKAEFEALVVRTKPQ